MGYAGVAYAYDGQNRRIWQWTATVDSFGNATGYTISFYGVNGQRLGAYTVGVYDMGPTFSSRLHLVSAVGSQDTYFGSRRLAPVDRLGTVRWGSNYNSNPPQPGHDVSYFPYGEEKASGSVPDDSWKFATYWRDSGTGLDYAVNRYYSSTLGRFTTPDPYRASIADGDSSKPQSWNRYAYSQSDPTNFVDPLGLFVVYAPPDSVDLDWCVEYDLFCPDDGAPVSAPVVLPDTSVASDSFLPVDDAKIDLGKKDCYTLLGFASAGAAQSWFDTIRFNYGSYGKLSVNRGSPAPDTPAPANTLRTKVVNINTDYNWGDFSKVSTQQGSSYNYLNYLNKLFHTNMTSEQLGTLIIIHELGHQFSSPRHPSDAEDTAEKVAVYNDCIK